MMVVTRIFLLLLALIAAPADARALAEAWQGDDAVSLRLISGVEGVGRQLSVPLGLEIKLASDWHTYWRTPGQAGLPPQFDWSKSQNDEGNLKNAKLFFPAPKRYTAFGLETIGYREHVVLPIDAELVTPGKKLSVNATLDILVCSQICLPKHFTLALDVPEGDAKPSDEAPLIEEFRNLIPQDREKSGLSVTGIASDGRSISADVASAVDLNAPDIFVENDQNIDFAVPTVTIAPGKRSVHLTVMPVVLAPGKTIAGMPLTLTIVDGDRALEQPVTVPGAAAPPASAAASLVPAPALPFALVLLFAIVGGFILNLMPCVLPVLSLKILSVVSHGGGEARVVRHSFLVTAAGILFSFLALAGVTIMLKEAGLAVGWGVQFQQPVFLGILVLLLTFFAANLWGLFEIHLPRWLADSFSGPYHPKLAGDFATGAFATLLATPCTAPFLGTAVGFALASGPRNIFVIFTALGFGMTVPYLAVALCPRLATMLPRPGAWMVHLRHLLGWALALTVLWLIWVLDAQIADHGAVAIGLCMLGIIGLLCLRHLNPRRTIGFGLVAFAALAFGAALTGSLALKPVSSIEEAWQPFDEAELAHYLAQGRTVFVDVTADWCLTCKANKKFILSQDEISRNLFHSSLVPMQANWTNPDTKIADFLHKYGRYGIPFNIVFGPGAPQGIVLPELLTAQKVLDALDAAEKVPQQ